MVIFTDDIADKLQIYGANIFSMPEGYSTADMVDLVKMNEGFKRFYQGKKWLLVTPIPSREATQQELFKLGLMGIWEFFARVSGAYKYPAQRCMVVSSSCLTNQKIVT